MSDKISILEKKIEQIKTQQREVCERRDRKSSCMPKEYYVLLKQRQDLEEELRVLFNKKSKINRESMTEKQTTKTFVNSFGEATKRYITTSTYENSCKKMQREIFRLIG